jgi:putative transcriptional regulator
LDNNLFDELVSSIKEAGAIKHKAIKTSRIVEFGSSYF